MSSLELPAKKQTKKNKQITKQNKQKQNTKNNKSYSWKQNIECTVVSDSQKTILFQRMKNWEQPDVIRSLQTWLQITVSYNMKSIISIPLATRQASIELQLLKHVTRSNKISCVSGVPVFFYWEFVSLSHVACVDVNKTQINHCHCVHQLFKCPKNLGEKQHVCVIKKLIVTKIS